MILPGPGNAGVWHSAQPMELKTCAPVELSVAGDGWGGSIVLRKATREVSGTASASGVYSSAPQPRTRSRGSTGLVTPISSRRASPLNSTSELPSSDIALRREVRVACGGTPVGSPQGRPMPSTENWRATGPPRPSIESKRPPVVFATRVTKVSAPAPMPPAVGELWQLLHDCPLKSGPTPSEVVKGKEKTDAPCATSLPPPVCAKSDSVTNPSPKAGSLRTTPPAPGVVPLT